ncbi:MAG TPA: hypothetical protein VF857_02120, partial [Spirochaetota bacterium]
MSLGLLHIAGFSAIFQSFLVIGFNLYESRKNGRKDGVFLSFLLLIISLLTFSAISRTSLT